MSDQPADLRRPAIFIDRDGTLIVERNYLCDPDQVELEQGAGPALARLAGLGFRLIGITNQSGVGRGYFGLEAVAAVNARVDSLLAAHRVALDGWYVCPHAPEAHCRCRKPQTGLIEQAQADFAIDQPRSWVIGDKLSDVQLGAATGCRGILVTTGHGGMVPDADRQGPWLVAANLADAAALIASAAPP